MDALLRFVVYILKSAWNQINEIGSGKWPCAEAVITAEPEHLNGFGSSTVEIVYSYRFEDELYTGLHEEPCFLSWSEYMKRFAKGETFVVRVKPGEPEVSVVRDADQADGLRRQLERIEKR
jgi:uncharacterized protein DUF3592